MTIRYEITLGARTTAGGEVISADPFLKIDDTAVAHEGDSVSCPACNTIGVIRPDGPRLSDISNGKQVALSGDLCICKCSQPPRLIESQTCSGQYIDGDWHAGRAAAAETAAKRNETRACAGVDADAVPLLLLDPNTEEPYRNRPYRLELKGGIIEGMTDLDGATRPLTAQERASFIRWHVESDDASA
ncbi:MAG: PAAR domain-containing protein [Pseudomonadota bacterium]